MACLLILELRQYFLPSLPMSVKCRKGKEEEKWCIFFSHFDNLGNSVNNINHLLKQRIIEYLSVQEDNSIPHIEDILAYLKLVISKIVNHKNVVCHWNFNFRGRYYEYARWKTQPLGAAVQKVLAFITLQNSKKSDTKRKKYVNTSHNTFLISIQF